MSDDETLHDLALRTRQLEEHLLRSPEYLSQVRGKVKWLVAVLVVAILLFFFEIIDFEKMHHMTLGLLGTVAGTDALAIADCGLLLRTRRSLHRLNERWLDPKAKKTLDSLRQQHAEVQTRAASANRAG